MWIVTCTGVIWKTDVSSGHKSDCLTWYRKKKVKVTVKSSWRNYFGFVVLDWANKNRLACTHEQVPNESQVWFLIVNEFNGQLDDKWLHGLNCKKSVSCIWFKRKNYMLLGLIIHTDFQILSDSDNISIRYDSGFHFKWMQFSLIVLFIVLFITILLRKCYKLYIEHYKKIIIID